MINLTNDAWSKTASAEYQHFAIAYFRAIELRTNLVRSTNAGYTCIINPRGEVIADLPLFREEALYAEIPVYEHQSTPFAVLKNWLPLVFFIVFIKMMWKHQQIYIKKSAIPVYVHIHWEEEKEMSLKHPLRHYKRAVMFCKRMQIRHKTEKPKTKDNTVKSKLRKPAAKKTAEAKTKKTTAKSAEVKTKVKKTTAEKKTTSASAKKTSTKKAAVKKTVAKTETEKT